MMVPVGDDYYETSRLYEKKEKRKKKEERRKKKEERRKDKEEKISRLFFFNLSSSSYTHASCTLPLGILLLIH